MRRRIVVCADGTWQRPEADPDRDVPTNVLRLARSIKPVAAGVQQQVFYDWGIGSYYDRIVGGATGKGLHKNIMDGYRYIVQNYRAGDEVFLFGYSRGAYTVRCLAGMINNCGILQRPDAALIQRAFTLYRKPGAVNAPDGKNSVEFRRLHSHASRAVHFVGVWETVGAMGIPLSFLGLLEDEDEFHDCKIGRNVHAARHAMAIDEERSDFEPTIWLPRPKLDLKQVWFAGAHADIGGGHRPGGDGELLSDTPLAWLMGEAGAFGLRFEPHLRRGLNEDPLARLHRSRRNFYRVRRRHRRPIDHGHGEVLIHRSVRQRFERDAGYRPPNLVAYLDEHGWPARLQ
ncbi:MAG: DUF2235 domain-containing protein [Gammaproteobacteria bacterium]